MTPWLDDGDVRLYHGDALQVLAGLPDGSVDCVVTSPPYWGLRDYGTGQWEGGDPDCDHLLNGRFSDKTGLRDTSHRNYDAENTGKGTPYRDVCGKCGATRIDQQLGLEPTPDLFVANMVAVFREVRRLLAPHGTCWVNLGDSYATGGNGMDIATARDRDDRGRHKERYKAEGRSTGQHGGWEGRAEYGKGTAVGGLKPKDLCGIPWRVAFALQQDGWYLRSDIIWAKPNPMPESVTDRPTKSHEYVFLLTKRPRYWFDSEAVREPHATIDGERGNGNPIYRADHFNHHSAGRNVRSVWNIATQPYPEAHFATFPEELARRCILAGCPARVCVVCGKPSERIVERGELVDVGHTNKQPPKSGSAHDIVFPDGPNGDKGARLASDGFVPNHARESQTVGWSDCGHNNWRPGVVLDPFIGSGTVAKVARDHQRHAIGIDLNEQYLELAARRLQQLSLLSPTIGE